MCRIRISATSLEEFKSYNGIVYTMEQDELNEVMRERHEERMRAKKARYLAHKRMNRREAMN